MATAVQQNGTQASPPPGVGHNSAGVGLDAWLDASREFGKAAGAGDTSMVGWFQDMVQRAYRDEIEPDMADKGTNAYQDSRRQRAAILGKRVSENSGKADKVRASEARKMIRLGKLVQIRTKDEGGLGVFNKALKVIADNPDIKGEVAKMLLKVASEQLRKPDEAMDEDYIRQVLAPKDTEDKGEGEYLTAAKKQIELAAKATSWDANKRAALTSINARIEQIGFKTASQRLAEEKAQAAEKKRKAAAKKAAKAKK